MLTLPQGLTVKDFKTPALCVRCWRLADYVQLETLKSVAISSLEDHLDAMALLATNIREDSTPIWLGYFLDALREVCANEVTEPLQTIFVAFLWVTRFEMSDLPQMWEALREHLDVNKAPLHLLIWNQLDDPPNWISNVEPEIETRTDITFEELFICSACSGVVRSEEEPRFYNPFPSRRTSKGIGQLKWCKDCVANINERRTWPWRTGAPGTWNKIKVEAWSWSNDG